MLPQIDTLLSHLVAARPGGLLGVYAYGSMVSTGLRPDSDIDLLLLTRRSLSEAERDGLVETLLPLSGWSGHAGTFPDAADRRPVELTSLVQGDLTPWTAAPTQDFQFGEWLRADLLAGSRPRPAAQPDVVPLVATALQAYRTLDGPALEELVAPVPPTLLREAVLATLPDLLDGLRGDERNSLLTLARIVMTVETGRIVGKDEAARYVAGSLDPAGRQLLRQAELGYLGAVRDSWQGREAEVRALAERLAGWARAGRGNIVNE